MATEDEMFGWHHQLNRHESEQILEVAERTGKSGLMKSMGLQRIGHDSATKQEQFLS